MVNLKSPQEIEEMKKCGELSARVLRMAGEILRPGISTLEIDEFIERVIRMNGATPSFKGLYGFPGSACISVNDEVVHGIPKASTIIKEGDVVSIDTGATVDGWVGDNAWTFAVGPVSSRTKTLLEVTEASMWAGIEQAVPGNHLGDIGHAIQEVAESAKLGILREYTGHGVGRVMHEDPNVFNYGRKGSGMKLEVGMVLAIEPMLTEGTFKVKTMPDGWTVKTQDGKNAAHFEKTIAITKDGPLVLTQE
ncbi:MAG: type I methionyl aminopeptidase [Coriobacteriia bacterium]|nr:type I methionyl aminopeptidase [Coriobacteriia bacterium]